MLYNKIFGDAVFHLDLHIVDEFSLDNSIGMNKKLN